ncbi:hypothetical protein MKW94_022537, partial [Papaver nudicaule]|nr:hypothetical protein [Papaver nudicaule]
MVKDSFVLMVEMKKKEDSGEPVSQFKDGVKKKNQECDEPVDKGKNQEEISSKDFSAKEEEVCQVHSLPPSIRSSSSSRNSVEGKQDEIFQVQDVITGDEHIILVFETTTQDDLVETKSISPSRILAEKNIWDHKKTTSTSEGWNCWDKVWKPVEKCFRRKVTETNLKKDVLSMFVEVRNVFCQKKSDGIKRHYSREEMEPMRFENLYQQRQIWREIYTGLGPVVDKELNLLAEARQNGNAIINRHQKQLHSYSNNNSYILINSQTTASTS